MIPKKSADSAESPPVADWQPTASGDATLKLSSVLAGEASALKMDFSFNGGGGFVVAKQVRKRSMPEEYRVAFRMRGHGSMIQLELKLADPSGRNVWRRVFKDLLPPARWTRVSIDSSEIEFAWGPAGSSSIASLGSIEIAVVAADAAQGTLWIADLLIEDSLPAEPPAVTASSALPDFGASCALDGPGWTPRADDLKPWIAVDLIRARRLGGLIVEWLGAAPTGGFRLRGSNSGKRWTTLYVAATAGGRRSYLYLPATRVRFLRLELHAPCEGARLSVQSFEFSRSVDAFWYGVARAEPRGWHPRWLQREQTVWTPLGTSHGTECALMNADGMIEVSQGSFSIEPMLWVAGRLFTWADVALRQELLDDWMPVPSVVWQTDDWRLTIQGEVTDSGVVRARYRLENLTAGELSARLFVLLRPFQVTPPWQSFRGLGGVSRLTDLTWREGGVTVNHATRIVADTEPAGFGAMSFDAGILASQLCAGTLPMTHEVHDEFGFATGALAFDWLLQAHAADERRVSSLAPGAPRVAEEPGFDWRTRFAVTRWSGNGWLGDAVRAALTATAHILVTRSGPALQPGPRRYTRSWIRDGAMMSAALLRMGHSQEVREFIRWYAPHQRADGFVPCCVDREGVDWLVEHDSHGQLIALIADYFRFTGDAGFVKECWTFVERAADCIESLLDATGLLPISVSHEGYLAQPVHSYWDDFWALRGLRDAGDLARELGLGAADRWAALSARFAASLFASLEKTRAERKLDYLPGSIEWADFDPTATANALYLLDIPDALDRPTVERTFDKYLVDWRAKRSGAEDWSNYTPYEIRIIGALVRMQRRDAALELLRFFLSDRRPLRWNQWPEIAWRDPQAPAHVGDLPHTWIAGEYVLAVRSLFAYEREADRALVVAAGLAPEWIDGEGVTVDRMPTLYGSLSYSLRQVDPHTLRFETGSAMTAKLVLRPPLTAPLVGVTIDGIPCHDFGPDSVVIAQAPAQVLLMTRR